MQEPGLFVPLPLSLLFIAHSLTHSLSLVHSPSLSLSLSPSHSLPLSFSLFRVSGGSNDGPLNVQCSRRWRTHVNPEVRSALSACMSVCLSVCLSTPSYTTPLLLSPHPPPYHSTLRTPNYTIPHNTTSFLTPLPSHLINHLITPHNATPHNATPLHYPRSKH